MLLQRRTFLKAAASSSLALCTPNILQASTVHQNQAFSDIIASESSTEITQKSATQTWAYNHTNPGPVLRLKHGQRAKFKFKNELPQASTIHWHGIRIDNAYDGVAGLTQKAVQTGEEFEYDFLPPDAGTYWYHPHNRSWEQMARGLHGALIIEEKEPPKVDRDLVLMLDDWLLTPSGQLDTRSLGSLGHWSHGGRTGNVVTINGKQNYTLDVRSGERLRLRLICAANSRVFNLDFQGHNPHIIAVDGQPVPPRQFVSELELGPGQRVDLILDAEGKPGQTFQIRDVFRGRATPISNIHYSNDKPVRESALNAPFALELNPHLQTPNFAEAKLYELYMEGGAMGRMEGAYMGERTSLKRTGDIDNRFLFRNELADHKLLWAFNLVSGMPEKPFFDVAKNRPVKIKMTNETAWQHVMHIHGHHGQVIEQNGKAVQPADWRDGFMVNPKETVTIGFAADNIGDWMLHCHMLEHQAAGMMTWFKVG